MLIHFSKTCVCSLFSIEFNTVVITKTISFNMNASMLLTNLRISLTVIPEPPWKAKSF